MHAPQVWQQPYARAPERNIALIIVGVVLILIALAVGAIFLLNFYQYVTIADKWANDPELSPEARDFGVTLVKDAAMGRMILFGPISVFSGLAGAVLGGLGLRKK